MHARILVELALDKAFDLQSFADGVTRWTLYAQFYQFLARRETEKPARSPIEARSRLEFLRRLALWLWQHRDGVSEFLEVAPAFRSVNAWCATLDQRSGALPVDYFLFLIDRAGDY